MESTIEVQFNRTNYLLGRALITLGTTDELVATQFSILSQGELNLSNYKHCNASIFLRDKAILFMVSFAP